MSLSLVHTVKMFELQHISQHVIDLLELCLITSLENGELCGIQPDHMRYSGPRLCEKSDRCGDVSLFDHDVCEYFLPCVRVQIRPLSIIHYEQMRGSHELFRWFPLSEV